MTLPEIVAVGIYNSKHAVKNTSISHNRKTAFFEIELPIEDGGISFIDDNQQKITTNTLICAKPFQTRHTKFPYCCYYIHMILRDGALCDALNSCPTFININNKDYFAQLFKKLIKYYKDENRGGEIMLNSVLLELIYAITKNANDNSPFRSVHNSSVVIKAVKYIKQNLADDLSLNAVSNYVCLSPIHFHNCFKSAVGKTLHEFVEEERLKAAINLLITSNMTLTEIAYRCGFSSQSYFSYAFKRKMKTTPRKYTQKLNQMYEI